MFVLRLPVRRNFVLSAVMLLLSASYATAQNTQFEHTTGLSRSEAELLIYFMPVSKQPRSKDFAVGWDIREDADSFHFWVFNAKRKCEGCSVTIGNYSVNKLTFVVTDDDLNKPVTNREIRGVQAILRDERQPQLVPKRDRTLFERAMAALENKQNSVANIEFQTLVNTYPDSEYARKAKLFLQDPRIANCGDVTFFYSDCDRSSHSDDAH